MGRCRVSSRPSPVRPHRADRVLETELEAHRGELVAYCYRMLGSPFEAEDAVQEAMLRAWRGIDSFEGRAKLRTWLYRIASNVCFDMLGASQRRARPMDLTGPGSADGPPGELLSEATWIQPIPDARMASAAGDPGDVAIAHETVRLAFIAALQFLPPRQRAVLLLRDVLSWQSSEVAALLGTTVASVNSALQRARATIAARDVGHTEPSRPDDDAQASLLARYLDAFQRYDMDALTALLHEDAVQSMPPYPLWLRGRDDVLRWWFGPGSGCRGSRLIPTVANGSPAFGQYRPSGPGGAHEPWALQVLEVKDGRVVEFTAFLDTASLFPLFGLPAGPEGSATPTGGR